MNRKSFALAFREMPDHLIPPKPGQPALIDQPPASPPDPPQLDPAPPDPPTLDPPPPDPRPRRWRLMGLGLILLIVLIAAVYLLTPLLPGGLLRSNESPGNRIMMRMIDVFVVIWIVWVGIAIGSFLNVVAYRLPAGKPLGGRSHCPRCESQLTWRDNTPVFGWLLLGGQCRHCGGAISRRYPTVEFLVGISIAAVVIPRLYNVPLPHDSTHWFRGHFGGHSLTDPMMWTRLLLHVIALATLWAMALIRWGRQIGPAGFVRRHPRHLRQLHRHAQSSDRNLATKNRFDGDGRNLADSIGRGHVVHHRNRLRHTDGPIPGSGTQSTSRFEARSLGQKHTAVDRFDRHVGVGLPSRRMAIFDRGGRRRIGGRIDLADF